MSYSIQFNVFHPSPVVFEMTNSDKSVFIDRNTSHIKHGWQEKRMIMEYNACVSCALIGHNLPTVLQVILLNQKLVDFLFAT